jgi:hypothetical protein
MASIFLSGKKGILIAPVLSLSRGYCHFYLYNLTVSGSDSVISTIGPLASPLL